MDRTRQARPTHDASASRGDEELLDAVRDGDSAAYGELWRRHSDAARRLAAAIAPASDVDDVVSESFTRVLRAINGGGGPQTAFRPYLLSAVRRVVIDTGRSYNNRVLPTDDEGDLDQPEQLSPADQVEQREQESIALAAWTSLPEESQALLWHLLVEGETPAQIAPILGTSANGVSSRAKRAKEKLRQAFLNEYTATAVDPECRRIRHRLGSHTRGVLPTKQSRNVRAHLRRCRECRGAFLVVADTNAAMRALVAPGLLGSSVIVGHYLVGAGTAAKGGAVLLGAKAAHGGWAFWPPPGLSSPGRVAAAGAATAAAVAVAVAAFALNGSPSHPAQAGAPSRTSAAAAGTSGGNAASGGASHSASHPAPAATSGTGRPATAVNQAAAVAHSSSVSTSSGSSSTTTTSTSSDPGAPTTSPTSPSAPPSSCPTTTPVPSPPVSPPSTPPSPPSSPPSKPPPPPSSATTLTFSIAVGPESNALVFVTSGWELVSIRDGAGVQHIGAPTEVYDGTVSSGQVRVTVRSVGREHIGSLTGVFTPLRGLALPRILSELLQPAS